MTSRDRPLLVFDGDCGFCTTSVRFVERRMSTGAQIEAYQFLDLAALGSTPERAAHEVLWVATDGRISGGAQAVAALLIDAGGLWKPLGLVARIPPVSWLAHVLYRLVAANRRRLPGGTAACALPPDKRPTG